MAKEKLYGGLILFFIFPILIYMTVANTNILLSNGIPSAYPYLGELFFSPWVYVVVPIMLVEFLVLGVLIWIGWNKMKPPKPIPLKEQKLQELE